MNIEIANRLVQLRKEKGYSQEELAAQLGISRQAVSKWERAESSPDTDNLILLARLYGISLDRLLMTSAPDEELRDPDKETTDSAPENAVVENSPLVPDFEPTDEPVDENVPDDEDVFRPDLLTGAVSLLAFLVFILLGFGWGLWHPGWLVFLLIPLYACTAEGNAEGAMFVLAQIIFFLLGFIWGLWHPGWIVFALIPLGAALHEPFRSIRRAIRRRKKSGQ